MNEYRKVYKSLSMPLPKLKAHLYCMSWLLFYFPHKLARKEFNKSTKLVCVCFPGRLYLLNIAAGIMSDYRKMPFWWLCVRDSYLSARNLN